MSEQIANNQRIAKNTLMLYFRLSITIVISLYTSRVILKVLGVEDYGIYNVVGGFVSMFAVFTSAMCVAVSRFITFELGRGYIDSLKRVFSTALFIQLVLTVLIVFLTESVGLWFVNNKLVIPDERLNAANWVFHFSVVTFSMSIIGIPFQSAIIAHEKMSAYAIISLIDTFTKLIVALSLYYSPIDKLVWYGLFLAVGSVMTQVIYVIYGRRAFVECRTGLRPDKAKLKEMFGFAGWNVLGGIAAIVRDQGGNMILNVFFGPAVNAARGIANQVCFTVNSFVTSFQTAINPQIIKQYASEDYDYLHSLIFRGSRFSAYIIFLFAIPIASNIDFILHFWLGIVPEHTNLFILLVFLFVIIEAISNPLMTAAYATGKMKRYQLIISPLICLNIPISYGLLSYIKIPELVFVVSICISLLSVYARLYILKSLVNISPWAFIKKVMIRVLFVLVLSAIIPFALSSLTNDSLLMVLFRLIISLVITAMAVLIIGCDKAERTYLTNVVMKKMKIVK